MMQKRECSLDADAVALRILVCIDARLQHLVITPRDACGKHQHKNRVSAARTGCQALMPLSKSYEASHVWRKPFVTIPQLNRVKFYCQAEPPNNSCMQASKHAQEICKNKTPFSCVSQFVCYFTPLDDVMCHRHESRRQLATSSICTCYIIWLYKVMFCIYQA